MSMRSESKLSESYINNIIEKLIMMKILILLDLQIIQLISIIII